MNKFDVPINDIQRQAFGRVGVLYGGLSAEREVSLQSGNAVLKGLLSANVDAIGVDIGQDAVDAIRHANFDRVFIVLHGSGGEDGQMQALLNFMGIPFTGSNVQASAIALDKLKCKQIWQCLKLPTPGYAQVRDSDDLAEVLNALGGTVFVKPIHEGSSIGMTKADSPETFAAAVNAAKQYDKSVLAEQFINGSEYTIAIVGDIVLPVVRLKAANEFYDYDAKYISNATQYFCPSGLSPERETLLQELAMSAYRAIGCSGWGRVDVMADSDNNFYLLEVNTVPGMTSHSLVPKAAQAYGWSFEQLVVNILATTLSQNDG